MLQQLQLLVLLTDLLRFAVLASLQFFHLFSSLLHYSKIKNPTYLLYLFSLYAKAFEYDGQAAPPL